VPYPVAAGVCRIPWPIGSERLARGQALSTTGSWRAAIVSTAGRSTTTQSLVGTNGRSKSKRMAVSLERLHAHGYQLFERCARLINLIANGAVSGEELMCEGITYTRPHADIAQR
jgi:hypothetical protein